MCFFTIQNMLTKPRINTTIAYIYFGMYPVLENIISEVAVRKWYQEENTNGETDTH